MIGVVTTSYPRWPGDPSGHFVAAHVAALRELGHGVDVLAAGEGPDRISSPLFYDGGAPDKLASRLHLADAVSFTARLTLAVARRRWTSIIAHWLAPSAIAALPSRAPLLAIAHGGDIHTLRRARLLSPVLHLLAARHARIAFVSHELLAIARAAAPRLRWLDDALVQPMGVDVAHFAALPRELTPRPLVVVAARLVPLKGVDTLLAALPHLATAVDLAIAGDGPERARLQAHAPAHVTFHGQLDTPARDRLLSRAALVAIPSRVVAGRTEGTPLIALEALAAGIPVVASRVGGLAELPLTHVAPDDPRALAAAIDRTLASPPPPVSLSHLDWRLVVRRLAGENAATP